MLVGETVMPGLLISGMYKESGSNFSEVDELVLYASMSCNFDDGICMF